MKFSMILGHKGNPNKDQSNIKYKQNKIKTIKTNDKQKFKKLTGETTLEITSGSVWGWHAPCELPRTSRPSALFPLGWSLHHKTLLLNQPLTESLNYSAN